MGCELKVREMKGFEWNLTERRDVNGR